MTTSASWSAALLVATALAGCDSRALVGAQYDHPDGAAPVAAPDAAPGEGGREVSPPPAAGGPGPWLFFDSLRGTNRDIYALNADGVSPKRITTSAAIEREPAVSPDGAMLAFSSDADGTFQLYLMPLPAGAISQITHHTGGAGEPAWSPDGEWLAFNSGGQVYVVARDGGNEHLVASAMDQFSPETHPVFLSDTDTILFNRKEDVRVLDLVTGDETTIARAFLGTTHPSVSPDGRTVAFSAMCGEAVQVWLAPLAPVTDACTGGTPLTSPTDGAARVPAFSPSGLIAFELGEAPSRLAVASPGGPLRMLTHGEGDDRNPGWSPASLVLP